MKEKEKEKEKDKIMTQKKSKNSVRKTRNNEDTSYNYFTSSRDLKIKRLNIIFEFLFCCKICFISLKNSFFKLISKFSFLIQSIIFKIPILIVVLLLLGQFNAYIFIRLYSDNYYSAVKNEYLNDLTKEIKEKYFELDTLETRSRFDEVEELLFFNIYYKELITMGLVDQKKIGENYIFPPITNRTMSIYSNMNKMTEEIGIHNDYNISLNDIKDNINNSKTIFSELAKVYFYLLPSITVNQEKQYIYLNQSFLIIYEYDDKLEEINKDNYFYFAYPKSSSLYNSGNNFNPGNVKTNPVIYKSIVHNFIINSNNNNDYDEENWFSKQDYLFRNNSDNVNKSIISFHHLNYNFFGKLNKTFIISLQSYFENKNKKYIINLINFFHQNNFTSDTLSYTIFLLNNNSDIYKPLIIEKYSDNYSYVISQSNITEISMSYTLDNYFHYGIKDRHNSYYEFGVSFDNFDLNKMSAPSRFYNTLEDFYADLIFIAQVYLLGKLFQRSEYTTKKTVKQDLSVYEFYNEIEVQKICKVFNFDVYIPHMNKFNIDCSNLDIVNKISDDNLENYIDGINVPYCGCLVFRCLDTNDLSIDEQFEQKKYNFVKTLKLPDRCRNYFTHYRNEKKSNSSNLIQQLRDRFLAGEDNKYNTFRNGQMKMLPGLSYFVITKIDNSNLITVLNGLIFRLTKFEITMVIVNFIWFAILLSLSIITIVFETKKFTTLILNFDLKFEQYLFKLEESKRKEKEINNNNNEKNKIIKISEKESILGSKLSRKKSLKRFYLNYHTFAEGIQESNPLLNELFFIFCDYYKLDAEEIIKEEQNKTEKSRKEIKANIMRKKNELFDLFVKLCSYESRMNFSMKYDLYSESPLVKNFNCSIKKGKINNKIEEKFTKDVIYELLSTENVFDDGLIMNFNFGYISYLNIDEFKSIKNALFNKKENAFNENFNMKQRLKDDQRKSFIKLILKNKNVLYSDLQKFYDFDEIKYDKLESCFNQFLLKVYYKYFKLIIFGKSRK